MVLFPVVNMPIFLVLRGLASRAYVSDDHGLLLTSTELISVFGQQYHRNRWASITWPSLPSAGGSRDGPGAPRGHRVCAAAGHRPGARPHHGRLGAAAPRLRGTGRAPRAPQRRRLWL